MMTEPQNSETKIIIVPIVDLKPNPRNPRQITRRQFEKLKKSIADCPRLLAARPVLVSTRTGENIIIAGNMRYLAASALDFESIPAIFLEGLSEAEEREIEIKDNGVFGEWDFDILANEFSDLPLIEWGCNWELSAPLDVTDINELCSFAIKCGDLKELAAVKKSFGVKTARITYEDFKKWSRRK